MVAYSFKRRFVVPIKVGLGLTAESVCAPKRQTIRADRKRHARPGEQVQLYTAMRTKQCELIGRARCAQISTIRIVFFNDPRFDAVSSPALGLIHTVATRNAFARSDGFEDWAALRAFWEVEPPGVDDFRGVIIFWEPLT